MKKIVYLILLFFHQGILFGQQGTAIHYFDDAKNSVSATVNGIEVRNHPNLEKTNSNEYIIHILSNTKLAINFSMLAKNYSKVGFSNFKIVSIENNNRLIIQNENKNRNADFDHIFSKKGKYYVSFSANVKRLGTRGFPILFYVQVHEGSGYGSQITQSICQGESITYPITKKPGFSYELKKGNVIVNDISLEKPNQKTSYILTITSNTYNYKEIINFNVRIKNRPLIISEVSPVQDVVGCGELVLSHAKPSLLQRNNPMYKFYFSKLLTPQNENMNARIYYSETCEGIKSAPYRETYSIKDKGTKTIYFAAKDEETSCWSNCSPITVTLNTQKPLAPTVSDQTACLCETENLQLDATITDPANTDEIRWYHLSEPESILKKTISITVPREDNQYYVASYNEESECESEKVAVNIYTTPCSTCIGEFAPVIGTKYVLSAWVKETTILDGFTPKASISIKYDGSAIVSGPFIAKGPIIEGWQKIESDFIVPTGAVNLYLELNNGAVNQKNLPDVFFDDIRIHPFNSSMISYVYDPNSKRLLAELDANNFATYYSYDAEGKVIATRKETVEGIKTIQETNTILKR